MIIAVGADHAGFILKEYLRDRLKRETGYDVNDVGAAVFDKDDDYPRYAAAVCRELAEGRAHVAVLVCGTGSGMAMAANRRRGIRAVACVMPKQAQQARAHLDANVLCLGADYVAAPRAYEILQTFLSTSFSGAERHARRLENIDANT